MVARIKTVAFQGIDVLEVDAQVTIASGIVAFNVVGLPDKAVAESRERVRAALNALGLALPPKRITVNLAPADLAKEGSHFDLPIALGLLAAMGVLPADEIAGHIALGELALDGALLPVAGVLPAAMGAAERGLGLICPAASGGEAAWAGSVEILAAPSLLALINHFKGTQVLSPPVPRVAEPGPAPPDLRDIKGQETAKRALEVAAAGGHNLLMLKSSRTSDTGTRRIGVVCQTPEVKAMAVLYISEMLDLPRCPHCGTNKPSLARVMGMHRTTTHTGQNPRSWAAYQCRGCGGVVLAAAPTHPQSAAMPVNEVYPSIDTVEDEVPPKAARYLAQAIESISSPDGAVMLAASAVDAMLKEKGYTNSSLYARLQQAAKDHAITDDMEKWAHQVRLDANDPRHADDENPHHDEASAKRAVDFAKALAQFMFVLPKRVTRGIKESGGMTEA